MPILDTYNYTYQRGRRSRNRGIANDPARRESERQQTRPGGKLTVDGPAETHAEDLEVERVQEKAEENHI